MEIPSPEELLIKVTDDDDQIQKLMKEFSVDYWLPTWRGVKVVWHKPGHSHYIDNFKAVKAFLLTRGWDFRHNGYVLSIGSYKEDPIYSLDRYKPPTGFLWRVGKAFRILIGKEN